MKQTLLLLVLVLAIALLFPAPALADGGEEGGIEFTQTIGGYTITLIFEKPAVVGENPVHLKIVDATGMPVSGAEVEISVEEHSETEESAGEKEEMQETPSAAEPSHSDSMSGMGESTPTTAPAINSMSPVTDEHAEMTALAAGHEDGEYEGELDIEKDGELAVRVHVTIAGTLLEAEFPIEVEKSNAGSTVLSVFAAINAAILGVAFVMKSQTGKA